MKIRSASLLSVALLGLTVLAACTSSDPVTPEGDEILLFADYVTADPDTEQFSAIIQSVVLDPDSGVRRDGVVVFFNLTKTTAGATLSPREIVTNDDGEAFTFVEADGAITVEARSGSVSATIDLDAEGGSTTVNQKPTARITVTTLIPTARSPATFDVSDSSDPDGRIDTWQILDWDDGSAASEVFNFDEQDTIAHTFVQAGTYNVRLEVTDDQGASDTATTIVTVIDG